MEITVSHQGSTKIVTLSGQIQHSDGRKLQETLGSLVAGDKPNIAADLSRVSYIGSSALGIFVSTLKSAKKLGGDLRLAGPAGMVMDILKVTRLSTIFQIHPTVAEAIASFSEG